MPSAHWCPFASPRFAYGTGRAQARQCKQVRDQGDKCDEDPEIAFSFVLLVMKVAGQGQSTQFTHPLALAYT
jgi:hypothetical protein